MVDETMPHACASHNFVKENSNLNDAELSEDQKQDQKNMLLRFLENQNAEALRAIQEDNSTFI